MEIMGSKKKEIRGWRLSSSVLGEQKVTVMNGSLQLEALAQVNGGSSDVVSEDGVVRVKIVVKKQDLKKVLEAMRGGKSSSTHAHHPPSFSPEQCLNLLRRRYVSRSNKPNRSRRSSWRPALHSIPEEL